MPVAEGTPPDRPGHESAAGKIAAGAAPRVMPRLIASPLTLAFLALAVGTFVLAGLQLSWISPPRARRRGAGHHGARVPAAGGQQHLRLLGPRSDRRHQGRAGLPSCALGLLLIGSATALLVPASVGAASKPLASAVITGVALRFYLTGGYELSAAPAWKTAGSVPYCRRCGGEGPARPSAAPPPTSCPASTRKQGCVNSYDHGCSNFKTLWPRSWLRWHFDLAGVRKAGGP